MRSLLAALFALSLAACATDPAPAQSAAQPAAQTAAKPAEAPKAAPQCYNSDDRKFHAIGARASVAGLAMECKGTADGKGAQWSAAK